MTTFRKLDVTCSNCETQSTHRVLGSTNQLGSPDLDLRPPEMARSTMSTWLQECPACGLVAPSLQDETGDDLGITESPDYLFARSDKALPALARRFVCGAIIAAARREPYLAFNQMLCAAWVADDEKLIEQARACRLKAVEFLDEPQELQQAQKVRLLDVLRRACAWDAAKELAQRLTSDGLDDKLGTIVAFQAALISRRDEDSHKIEEALPSSPSRRPQKPQEPEQPASLLDRLKRWIWLLR